MQLMIIFNWPNSIILCPRGLQVINKTDIAAAIGADLGVMERDALRMRDGGPFVFAQVLHFLVRMVYLDGLFSILWLYNYLPLVVFTKQRYSLHPEKQ